MFWRIVLLAMAILGLVLSLSSGTGAKAQAGELKRYIVVFAGAVGADGAFVLDRSAALAAVASAGGSISLDLSGQIGVALATSGNALFADALRASGLVEEVGEDFGWKQFQTLEEATANGTLVFVSDPLEVFQWSMQMIRAPQAQEHQAGQRAVSVGILDTGIDGDHVDFNGPTGSNVDCARGRDFIPLGPGAGSPSPCVDNNFHGTHVAGIVAAQRNGLGVVGVAPGVTLVPVKVCDAVGFCYAGPVVAGITYAGDARFDVINMSFFMDDDTPLASTEFKCNSDPKQRAFRRAGERAVQYARAQGVTPVAALGNSDTDLAKNPCDTVPAESSGVIGTMALGRNSQKASYSSYGVGATDVAAPGGAGTTGDCTRTVLSTFPGNIYGCIQGTSMASPHSAGVAALIVSQLAAGATDVNVPPTKVEARLQSTTIDIGLSGYDKCFGHGRIDALRAVLAETSSAYDATAPFCPEYNE